MTLRVDTLNTTAGTTWLVNGYPRRPGRMIEMLSSPCDGSVVTVGSGTYQFESVTGIQTYSTVYQTITGSSILYQAPIGSASVQYNFHFASYWGADHAINDYKFFVDGAEVTKARHNRSGRYNEDRLTFDWTIDIGGTADVSVGRQATWTQPKLLSMQFRGYGASNYNNLHGTYYWDGVTSTQFSMPILTITAFA